MTDWFQVVLNGCRDADVERRLSVRDIRIISNVVRGQAEIDLLYENERGNHWKRVHLKHCCLAACNEVDCVRCGEEARDCKCEQCEATE